MIVFLRRRSLKPCVTKISQSISLSMAKMASQDFDEMAGNLLENAFRWARNNVEVHAHHDEGRSVAIVIEDDGSGLRPEQIPHSAVG
jgi:signal transduction histidine kinase